MVEKEQSKVEVKVTDDQQEEENLDALVEKNLGDRYELIERIGSGGMGAVYKVRNKALDKIFAVKILNPSLLHDRASKKRFEAEAEAASKLTHVGSVAVYEYGAGEAGAPFIVMDYLDGTSLEQMIRDEGMLDPTRALDIFIQAGEAVEHAHMKGLVHRDIKPANIMITREGKLDIVKLVDFGISKVLNEKNTKQGLTQTGDVFGSPLYMSPEQCQGIPVDGRADIYSLGCVMYEALTGRAPFKGANPIQTILKHINDDAPAFATPRIPTGLEEVIRHCLEKDPSDRYQSVSDLLQDLRAVRDGRKISVSPKRQAPSRNQSKIPFITVIVGVLLIAASALVFSLRPPAAGGDASSPLKLTDDAINDAQQLDARSFYYFNKGEYDKAIPMLEFGIKTYQENGTRLGRGGEDTYLADNYQHIGKCYLKLGKYEKAAENYYTALGYYKKWGNYKGGMMGEAVTDYADVLQHLGRGGEAEAMQKEFQRTNNLKNVPPFALPLK